MLSNEENIYYSRHILLEEIGEGGVTEIFCLVLTALHASLQYLSRFIEPSGATQGTARFVCAGERSG